MSFSPTLCEDLFHAYFDARKNKRNSKAQLQFEINLEENLFALCADLCDQTYAPLPSDCFIVNHPVKREVFASQFRDRVVHHLLYNYIAPIFEKAFIHDSYSCRKGKGTLFGIERLEHHIRSCTNNHTCTAYILKLDVQGYFMNINKGKLYDIITARLDKHWSMNGVDVETPACHPGFIDFLLRSVIFKEPTTNCIIKGTRSDWEGLPPSKSLFTSPKGIGLPIGDLTSQLFSNIYLGVLDDYVKRTLRIKHYGRYVDDFYVIHRSKSYLKGLITELRMFLSEHLGLTLHPRKIYLQHYSRGVNFLGAFVKPLRKYSSHRSVRQFRAAVSHIKYRCKAKNLSMCQIEMTRATLNSYCGYLKKFKTQKIVVCCLADSDILNHFEFIDYFSKVSPLSRYACQQKNRWRLGSVITDILTE